MPPGDPRDTAPYPEGVARPQPRDNAKPSGSGAAKKKKKSTASASKGVPETTPQGLDKDDAPGASAETKEEKASEPANAANAAEFKNVNMLAMYLCGNGKTGDKTLFC